MAPVTGARAAQLPRTGCSGRARDGVSDVARDRSRRGAQRVGPGRVRVLPKRSARRVLDRSVQRTTSAARSSGSTPHGRRPRHPRRRVRAHDDGCCSTPGANAEIFGAARRPTAARASGVAGTRRAEPPASRSVVGLVVIARPAAAPRVDACSSCGGECYQVNLTRRRSRRRALDPVVSSTRSTRWNPAPHADALVTFRSSLLDLAIVSASPELFLRIDEPDVVDADRSRAPRPPPRHARHQRRRTSAENVMIVDLARNDLGRVCEYGSVECRCCARRVAPRPPPSRQHRHRPAARRRRFRTMLVRATFPPASVTGAPKPRV